tara:strand:+ start:409 stop:666 length:258 start_codon:yes stop_codon:yes gene_type:complete
MSEITEQQLRKIRHSLFGAMDKKLIDFSPQEDVKQIQEHALINDIVKYVGLEPSSDLTKQLRAEYKTWKQQMNSNIEELRNQEKI